MVEGITQTGQQRARRKSFRISRAAFEGYLGSGEVPAGIGEGLPGVISVGEIPNPKILNSLDHQTLENQAGGSNGFWTRVVGHGLELVVYHMGIGLETFKKRPLREKVAVAAVSAALVTGAAIGGKHLLHQAKSKDNPSKH